MQVLEKQKNVKSIEGVSSSDIEKIIIAKNNFKKNGKTYNINDAYKLGLSKLDF